MKYKHLLTFSFIAFTVVVSSCSKNNGLNIPTVFTTVIKPDTSGSNTNTPPVTITVGADAPPANGDNSNLLMGNPSAAATDVVVNKDNYLINQGYYVESYNSTKLEPNWVSWHLDASNITNATGRQDSFAPYAGLPTGYTQVLSTSYQPYATYGFDRGHNCPSADRSSSINANNATFLMTNMIPQAPANNQGTWANLEGFLRGLVGKGNEIYIIMGNYGTGGTGLYGTFNNIGVLKVNVPSYVWKVAVVLPVGDGDLARVNASTRVIAVNTPNIESINADWTKYIVTVRDIETATGFNLLSALPQSVQDAVETKKDSGI